MFEPLPEDEQLEPEPQSMLTPRAKLAAAVVALSVFGFGSYAVHERNVAGDLSKQNAKMQTELQMTNAQVEQLSAKINTIAAAPATQPEPQPAPVSSAAKPKAHVQHAAKRHVRHDDPRWKKLQSQLDDQNKAIASTQQDLASSKAQLGDSIARTHNELVVLQKKGERRYFEFDIDKAKRFSPAGAMSVKLRKSNVKHQYADLDLLVDDRVVTKKHVNLYEPTQFYTGDNEQPMQVVINSITKDHIHGYVTEPKYQKSELAAMQGDSDASTPSKADRQPMTVGNK